MSTDRIDMYMTKPLSCFCYCYCFCFFSFIFLPACRKSNGLPHPCIVAKPDCSHQPGDITGHWMLEGWRSLRSPGKLDPEWQPADCSPAVILEFRNDSTFHSNYYPPWLDSALNHFTMANKISFTINSSDSRFFSVRSVEGIMVNGREIQLRYMGIDLTREEIYTCYD